MDNAVYTALTRQSGLMTEMRSVANNIANMSTTGYRREGVVFAEHIARLGAGDPSLSMATAEGHSVDLTPGAMAATGGSLDAAIEGEGFFMVEGQNGNELTRSGAFTVSPEGALVTVDGRRVLDASGAPILVPTDAGPVSIARDGTMAAAGQPIARLGVFAPVPEASLTRVGNSRFRADGGETAIEAPTIFQGFLEGSNVDPVLEITRMIEVQRAYEAGQNLLDAEDQRIRSAVQAMTR